MKKPELCGNRNVISKQLKLARIKADMTQDRLAAKMQIFGINIDQRMISRIEHNRRFVTDYELACFCQILKISEKEMLSDFYEEFLSD